MDSMTWLSGLKKRVPAPFRLGAGGLAEQTDAAIGQDGFDCTLVSSPCPRRPPPHSPAVPILPTHGWLQL